MGRVPFTRICLRSFNVVFGSLFSARPFSARSSRLALLGSLFSARSFRLALLGSLFSARSSRLALLGSLFSARSSRLAVLGSLFFAPSRLALLSCPPLLLRYIPCRAFHLTRGQHEETRLHQVVGAGRRRDCRRALPLR